MFCNSAQPLWEMPRQLKTAAAKLGLQESWAGDKPVVIEVLRPACGEGHTLRHHSAGQMTLLTGPRGPLLCHEAGNAAEGLDLRRDSGKEKVH